MWEKFKNLFTSTPQIGKTGTDIEKPVLNGTTFEEPKESEIKSREKSPDIFLHKLNEPASPKSDPKSVPTPVRPDSDTCETDDRPKQAVEPDARDRLTQKMQMLQHLKDNGAMLMRPRTAMPEALRPVAGMKGLVLAGGPLRVLAR